MTLFASIMYGRRRIDDKAGTKIAVAELIGGIITYVIIT